MTDVAGEAGASSRIEDGASGSIAYPGCGNSAVIGDHASGKEWGAAAGSDPVGDDGASESEENEAGEAGASSRIEAGMSISIASPGCGNSAVIEDGALGKDSVSSFTVEKGASGKDSVSSMIWDDASAGGEEGAEKTQAPTQG